MVMITPRSQATVSLMGKSDRYYVIYEPRDTWDHEPYCLYGEIEESQVYPKEILRLSFDEVRWIMSERIRILGGEPLK